MRSELLSDFENRLLEQLEKEGIKHDVEIVTLSVVGAKSNPILRVYIDTPNGISFEDLSSNQSWIASKIEDIDPFDGAYTLEVSSPGIDRPLRTLEHFDRFVGQDAYVRCQHPINGQRNFKGQIAGTNADFAGSVAIKTEDGTVNIKMSNIKRANLIGTI